MINPYLIGAAILSLVLAYAGGRWEQHGIEEGKRAGEESVALKAREAAQTAIAEGIRSLEVTRTTIRQPLEIRTREVPIYRDLNCQFDPAVVGLLNNALSGYPAQPAADRKLSGDVRPPG